MNECIEKGQILYCDKCLGPCKPNVVFYGESLPRRFFEKMDESRCRKNNRKMFNNLKEFNILFAKKYRFRRTS